jgi:hypothetical protein
VDRAASRAVAKAVRNKVEVKRVEAKKAAAVEDRKVEAAVVKRCKTRARIMLALVCKCC